MGGRRPPATPAVLRLLDQLLAGAVAAQDRDAVRLLEARRYLAGQRADLDRAISEIERAVQLTAPGDHDLPTMLNSLSNRLADRFIAVGQREDLDRAITEIEQALRLTAAGDRGLPAMLDSLGNRLAQRFGVARQGADMDRAISAIEGAVQVTGVLDLDRLAPATHRHPNPAIALEADGRHEDLQRIVELYAAARAWFRDRVRLFGATATARHFSRWPRLADRSAAAHLEVADLPGAVEALEEIRCLRLGDATSRLGRQLHEAQTHNPDLVDVYRRVVDVLANTERAAASGMDVQADIEQLRAAFDTATAAMRDLPGLERFGQPPTLVEIAAGLPPGSAAAILTATDLASWLVLDAAGHVTHVPLDASDEHLLGQVQRCHAIALGPHMAAAYGFLPDDCSDQDFEAWYPTQVAAIATDVGARLLAPLLAALPAGNADVVVVATGHLALLPLHAAIVDGRPAADAVGIRYSPTLSALVDTPLGAAAGAAVVVKPRSSLRLAAAEAEAVAGLRGHAILADDHCTTDAVSDAFRAAAETHATCHGQAHPAGNTTRLELTDAHHYSVERAYGLPRTARHGAVFAACCARTPNASLPDELKGFPNAFLSAGHPFVIAAHWPVTDGAAYAYSLHFHRGRAQNPQRPARDVHRDTIRWLIGATGADLAALHRNVIARLAAAGRDHAELSALTPLIENTPASQRLFAEPVDWAAMAYTGR